MTAASVLTVAYCEDDPSVRRLLGESIRAAGHRGLGARRSAEALTRFDRDDIDVLVLEVGLPDGDGRELCRALRANGQTAPVLFLSANGAVHDVVAGFNAGGLDYLVRPFAVPELLARVEALGRRRGVRPAANGLEVDSAGHRIRTPIGERTLTPTEFRIVAALLASPGRVVRRADLAGAARIPGARVQGDTLDAYVHRLRRHLEQIGAVERIVTVRGAGYLIR